MANLILNILWALLGGGIFLFLGYALGALVLALTIVGIPFAIPCLRLAVLTLMPFGRVVVHGPGASGCLGVGLNVLWILVVGISLATMHLFFGLFMALTLIGIPFALQHAKLAMLSLVPFGAEVRDAPAGAGAQPPQVIRRDA